MSTLNTIYKKLFSKNDSVEMIVDRMSKRGMDLEAYPWDECIAEQTKRYGAESAPKICGYIKEKYGN